MGKDELDVEVDITNTLAELKLSVPKFKKLEVEVKSYLKAFSAFQAAETKLCDVFDELGRTVFSAPRVVRDVGDGILKGSSCLRKMQDHLKAAMEVLETDLMNSLEEVLTTSSKQQSALEKELKEGKSKAAQDVKKAEKELQKLEKKFGKSTDERMAPEVFQQQEAVNDSKTAFESFMDTFYAKALDAERSRYAAVLRCLLDYFELHLDYSGNSQDITRDYLDRWDYILEKDEERRRRDASRDRDGHDVDDDRDDDDRQAPRESHSTATAPSDLEGEELDVVRTITPRGRESSRRDEMPSRTSTRRHDDDAHDDRHPDDMIMHEHDQHGFLDSTNIIPHGHPKKKLPVGATPLFPFADDPHPEQGFARTHLPDDYERRRPRLDDLDDGYDDDRLTAGDERGSQVLDQRELEAQLPIPEPLDRKSRRVGKKHNKKKAKGKKGKGRDNQLSDDDDDDGDENEDLESDIGGLRREPGDDRDMMRRGTNAGRPTEAEAGRERKWGFFSRKAKPRDGYRAPEQANDGYRLHAQQNEGSPEQQRRPSRFRSLSPRLSRLSPLGRRKQVAPQVHDDIDDIDDDTLRPRQVRNDRYHHKEPQHRQTDDRWDNGSQPGRRREPRYDDRYDHREPPRSGYDARELPTRGPFRGGRDPDVRESRWRHVDGDDDDTVDVRRRRHDSDRRRHSSLSPSRFGAYDGRDREFGAGERPGYGRRQYDDYPRHRDAPAPRHEAVHRDEYAADRSPNIRRMDMPRNVDDNDFAVRSGFLPRKSTRYSEQNSYHSYDERPPPPRSQPHFASDPSYPPREAWNNAHNMLRPGEYRVLYAYRPTEATQLELAVGDVVRVKGDPQDNWQYGYNTRNQKSGWFPRTYLDFSNDQDAVDRLRRNRELPTAPSHQQMPNLPRPDY
eukprot:m.110286 g.110286  ORF g.110286 m.110286 type:complete len:900 (-) comp15266_c0_seq2:141-2840(-)